MTLDVTAFTGLGEGQHDVVVTSVTVKTAKAGGEYLRWEFADHDGKTTSDNTSKEITPGNKTGKRFATLTGVPTVVGTPRHITEVIGKPCTIEIEINPEGYPKITNLMGRAKAPQARTSPVVTAASAEAQHAAQEGVEHDPGAVDPLPF